ncbi:MAG TPA: hypothetical protein VKT77_05750 [Chthonomonadaceae bacterium]|nr:hypothetical protein [Chthonomonadaceae bacterium]
MRNRIGKHRVAMAVILGLTMAFGMAGRGAGAQAAVSADPQVRASQQWEDLLLLEAFDYLQITPQQRNDLQPLADYARTRLDEVEQRRARLEKAIQDQHAASLKGQLPTAADQTDVLQKQRSVQDQQDLVSREVVDRLAPKLGAILTRRQIVRAWLLMQNKISQSEPKRVALTDPSSGFAYPQMEARDAIEEMVKVKLREKYSNDVLDQALMPWELSSLAGLAGGIGGGIGGGPNPPGGAGPQQAVQALQALQEMDPRMGTRMMQYGQRMMKQMLANGGLNGAPTTPPVSPEVRAAVNKDAAEIRKSIEADPEAYLSQAQSAQVLEALRPLARRLFLSQRLKDALAERVTR